jgi:hypothetical protein
VSGVLSSVVGMKGIYEGGNLPVLVRRPRRQPSLDEAAVLAAARQAKRDADAAEARKLAAAVAWASLHQVDDPDLAETWDRTPVTLAGEGAPLIEKGCVAEFASVIGTTTNGGRNYLEHALELAHRFPNLYARIQAGEVPVWKGRQLANQTIDLTAEAAADLDLRVTPLAKRLSTKATEQLVHETLVRFMPELSQEMADASSVQHVYVDHRQVSFFGTSAVHGSLDLADALDLDEALNREAETLRLAGCEENLDARRAMALGRLARGEAAGRQVDLYVHLPSDTNPTALVENGGGAHLLTQEQVAVWCGRPDVTVVIKPVIDLHNRLAAASYAVPEKIKEHLELRDRKCVFPFCERLARDCQKDHTRPFPEGATDTDNLASLCQYHHNLKTHAGWSYTSIEPGVYLWRSPHGYTYLRDDVGTQELTPGLVDPPGS